nr:hypothetical protein [Tanacetum cinerariifolium]
MMRATPSPIPLPPSFLPFPIRPPHTKADMAQIADIPEADMPLRKRLLLTAPTPRFEVREGSAAARQSGSTVACMDAQDDRAAVRAEIEILRRERLTYERERVVRVVRPWLDADDHATKAIMRIQVLEAGARTDTLEDSAMIQELAEEDKHLLLVSAPTVTYSNELSLMCSRIFLEESDEIEKYVGGLPNMIHGSVMASKPKTMQDAIEFATKLMDKKYVLWLNDKLKIKGSLRKLQGTIKSNSSLLKGIMWHGLTLLGLVRRDLTKELNLCVLSKTITMTSSVLPSEPIARGMAIQPKIVEASLLLPTTTREPKGKIKEFSLDLSVELRAISRIIMRN